MSTHPSPNEPQPPSLAFAPAQPVRKKRRWWFYVLIVFAVLLCLAITVFIGISSYYKSLVRTYTSTKPLLLAKVEPATNAMRELTTRYEEFAKAILQKQNPDPFKITTDEINRIIAANNKMKGIVCLIIEGNQLELQFSLPLDQTHRKELKGRFLNGLARLKLELADDGFLNLNVASIDANGKPIPNWIFKKIKDKNFLSSLDHNFEFLEVLQQMNAVEIKDGAVVFTPALAGK